VKNSYNLFSPVQLAFLGICFHLILAPSQVTARAEDWPRFLGPRADATSTETGLIDSIPAAGAKIVWENKVGTGYSAPSVRKGQLVLHHRIGGDEIVESFSADAGKAGWNYKYPSRYVDPYGYNNGPRCTPLLTEKYCYTFGAEGKLLCLELATGKLVWERDTAKDWEIPEAFFGVGSTPILEGDTLIVMVGGQPNSGVVGFDALTGKTKWESVGEKNWRGVPMSGWPGERNVEWVRSEKQASYATPVAATVNGARQVFCLTRQGLVSINPTNGAVNFSFWFRSRLNDSVNASCPVVIGNQVFISAAYYKVGSVLLEVQPDNKSVKEIWRGLGLEMHWSTPNYKDGYLYGFSGRNEPDAFFRCIEYKTGNVMWERDERWQGHMARSTTFGRGSGILADGRLYVLGEAGFLGIFNPNPQKLEELARWQVPSLHYPCWAGPVLSEKKLYLRSEDRLVCIDLAKR
jgi:outer membrane protein assembly factor BamB